MIHGHDHPAAAGRHRHRARPPGAPGTAGRGVVVTVVLAALVALTSTLLTVPSASAADGVHRHPFITWNMRGTSSQGESIWWNAVAYLARRAPIVMLQEAGTPPPVTAPRPSGQEVQAPEPPALVPDTGGLRSYRWNIGTRDNPDWRILYWLETDQDGGRVNYAMITADLRPQDIAVFDNPEWGGRRIPGIRFGDNWTLNFHARAHENNDAQAVVERLATREPRLTENGRTWTLTGDFNQEPETLRARLTPPEQGGPTVENSRLNTFYNGGDAHEYDYAVAGGNTAETLVARRGPDRGGSDHWPVAFGADLPGFPAPEQPPGGDNVRRPPTGQNETEQPLGDLAQDVDDKLNGVFKPHFHSPDKRGAPPPENPTIQELTRWVKDQGGPQADLYTLMIGGREATKTPLPSPPGLSRTPNVPQRPPRYMSDMMVLVDTLLGTDSNRTVIVATLPEFGPAVLDPPPLTAAGPAPGQLVPQATVENVKRFNDGIRTMVGFYQSQGKHVELAESHLLTPEDFQGKRTLTDDGTTKLVDAYTGAIKSATKKGWIADAAGDTADKNDPPRNEARIADDHPSDEARIPNGTDGH